MPPARRRHRPGDRLAKVLTWLGLSLLAHVLIVGVGGPIWEALEPEVPEALPPMQIVMLDPTEEEEEPEEEPEPVDYDGQIVDVVSPEDPQKPEDADYLAEADNRVEQEMKTQWRINPEVLSNVYSPDDKVEMEDLVDVNATEPSTGAQVGNDRFDPDRHGAMASLPSPYRITNKDGFQAPTVASHSETSLAGAPNNDLLDVPDGEATYLNTKEFLYASYINQIRRMVAFYWDQNLDNLPTGLPFSKPLYMTAVHVTITSDGRLESIQIVTESGMGPLDNAVVQAWWSAGPFPPPPEGLVEADGRAYLPEGQFTVNIGQADNRYMGVDPRGNVQFPGILKSPR
ncbi:MAG: TonB family protein [Myxococcota bacterium]|nr:TonB family protein [Myxococcota bacterium]